VAGVLSRLLINIALVFATGFLLLVSLVVTATIGAATARLRASIEGPDLLWLSIDFGIGLVVTAVIFGLIFKTLPATKVTWRDVRVGAVVTAILFTAGRLALGLYLGRSSGDSAYTAAGALLALLIWVYYSSQLILFGAEFTVVYARRYETAAPVSPDDIRALTLIRRLIASPRAAAHRPSVWEARRSCRSVRSRGPMSADVLIIGLASAGAGADSLATPACVVVAGAHAGHGRH
jgi:uncharacterized BrkB/YihY/UPF0761 family membrane protein